jgi:hypothetical protein
MACQSFISKDCEVFSDNRKLIPVEENKRKYVAVNKSGNLVSLLHVDNCLITDSGLKCDYLLLNCDKKASFFIELKGADLIHAIDQVDRSIDLLLPKIGGFSVNARIVLSKVYAPDLRSNQYKRLENKLKKLGGNIQKKEKILQEDI